MEAEQKGVVVGVGTIVEPLMTKRELFAAMAMQGLLSDTDTIREGMIAVIAVEYADALIAELEKSKP